MSVECGMRHSGIDRHRAEMILAQQLKDQLVYFVMFRLADHVVLIERVDFQYIIIYYILQIYLILGVSTK